MAIDDDTASCSTTPVDSSPKTPKNQQRQKLQVYDHVLRKLHDSASPDAMLPGFQDRLWLHFNRLPFRYALDVNVERAEDVLTHMRLLRLAEDQDDPLPYHVRLVQVNPTTNAYAGDSVHSYSSADEASEGSVKNSFLLGLSLSLHYSPSFGSLPKQEAFGFQPNVEDRDSCVNNTISQPLRAMHEITFSAVDKPKLLTQLTSLLSEMGLNIQEAHAFSTVDGFSLDVFVVGGWHEETEQLINLLDKEIRKIKAHY